MSVSSLCCDVCFEPLDGLSRRPMVICPNGHSVCSPCSVNMKLCPQCRAGCLPQPIANISLLKLLDGLVNLKLVVLGEAGVGKSALMLRFTEERFVPDLLPTVGLDFRVKVIELGGYSVKLAIWDTAGQERFRNITASYYRGAHAVVLVYDITRRITFEKLEHWLDEEMKCLGDREQGETIKLVIANKADKGNRQVAWQEGRDWAESQGMLFAEVSASQDREGGVEVAFLQLVDKVLQTPGLWQVQGKMGPSQAGLILSTQTGVQGQGNRVKSQCCS